MHLTQDALDEVKAKVARTLDGAPAPAVQPALALPDLNMDLLCENRQLCEALLQSLVPLLPGMLGKIAGQMILATADAYFDRRCGPN